MSSQVPPRKKRIPIVGIAVVCLVAGAGAILLLREVGWAGMMTRLEAGIDLVRAMGPWVFFAAMMVLPAFGVPMLAFTIPAGEAFAARLGMAGVVGAALAAIAVNLAFTYWIARYALRPLALRLVTRYGYTIPQITRRNALNVLLVVRLTPGPPYALQCFVLGIAEAPFGLYMLVSWIAILPYALGALILGEGLLNGNFKVVMAGIGLVVAATVGLQWLRKRYFAREG